MWAKINVVQFLFPSVFGIILVPGVCPCSLNFCWELSVSVWSRTFMITCLQFVFSSRLDYLGLFFGGACILLSLCFFSIFFCRKFEYMVCQLGIIIFFMMLRKNIEKKVENYIKLYKSRLGRLEKDISLCSLSLSDSHLFLKPFIVHSSRVGDWVKFVIDCSLLSYLITAKPSWDLF